MQSPSSLILWDVVEEHLDEAEFLFERWNGALHLPGSNLSEIARTLEPRLIAHLDALSISPSEVAQRILLPALAGVESPARAAVAALALLAGDEGTWDDAVIQAAQQASVELQSALIRGLVLSDSSSLGTRLQERYRANPEDAFLLQVLTGRNLDPGALLRAAVDSRDPELVPAARSAVVRFGRREFYYAVGIDSRNGLPRPCHELETQLRSPETAEVALWNLGYCGTVQAGDVCSSFLLHPNVRLRKLAADSLAWIGGFDPNDRSFLSSGTEGIAEELPSLPPFEEENLKECLELDGVDTLPVPNPEVIAQWWQEHRAELGAYSRCLLGRPFSLEAVTHALLRGTLWRRHSLAEELCAQSDGRRFVATDAFSSRQYRQIASLVA